MTFIQVSLHGGQVLSWRNDHDEELLFTSSKVNLPLYGFLAIIIDFLEYCIALRCTLGFLINYKETSINLVQFSSLKIFYKSQISWITIQ